MERQQIGDRVSVFTSALYQTNSTVIISARDIFVVDPNWLPHEVAEISSFVLSNAEDKQIWLIFTHSDYDHIIGYGAFKEVKVIASRAFAENTSKERDVEQARDFDRKHYVNRPYPIAYPAVDKVIDHDGQQLVFSDIIFTFYLASGHTDEGIFIITEPDGLWIAGDYLSDIEFPLINGTPDEYNTTLQKVDTILEHHKISGLIPGHGSVATNPDEILQRKTEAEEYLSDLRNFCARDIRFPEEAYKARYPFWEGIMDWHKENITRFRQSM